MKTIFKYDTNNFMKAEINNMPSNRKRRIFKLMNLLGDFSFVTNLYIDDNDLDGTVKVITFDKDDSKITFFPRSINKYLEKLVLINELQHCEAYSIENMDLVGTEIESLKIGEVIELENAKVIIDNKNDFSNISVYFYDGTTYKAQLLFSEFNWNRFVSLIRVAEKLDFSNFFEIVLSCINSYFELSCKCEKGNEVFADLKIRNGELYKNDSITQDNELKRILVKYSVKKD